MPLVSIILPTYNGARFIRRAIESVRAQSVTDWELLIVNDGSSDATGSLITEISAIEPRIRILNFRENKGIQKALNEGLLQSKGEYIARIDDDDVWSDAHKLDKQLTFMAENPDCVLVGTGLVVQNENGDELYRFLNPVSDFEIRCRILYRNCFSHSTVLFKKAAALKFNGYDESELARHTEDYDLWLKLGTVGSFANLPEYSVRFTSRPGNISSKNKLSQFRHQLAITGQYRGKYPGYIAARIKSYLRLWLYAALGAFVSSKMQARFIGYYKRV